MAARSTRSIPQASEVEGLKAYPEPRRDAEARRLRLCGDRRQPHSRCASRSSNGNCRIAQVISSGFGEVEEGRELEARSHRRRRRSGGVRVLGPQLSRDLFPARRADLPFRRAEGSRRDRRRLPVRRALDRHHKARPVARPALQRPRHHRQQRRRAAARTRRILPGRPADQGDRRLHGRREGRPAPSSIS